MELDVIGIIMPVIIMLEYEVCSGWRKVESKGYVVWFNPQES